VSCWRSRLPKSRQDFWEAKLAGNVTRDEKVVQALRAAGWDVLTVWECETVPRKRELLKKTLSCFLQ